jgi:putative flippase GtrA
MIGPSAGEAALNESGRVPATRRWHEHSLPRFLTTGGLTFAVDITMLKVLHGVLDVNLVLATAIAFACAFAVNFTLSRQWAFVSGQGDAAHRQMVRFIALVGVNLVTTVAIVAGLSAIGLNYLIAKVVATALNATGNYLAYRYWVFR